MRALLAMLILWVLAAAARVSADPFYLPPVLDRVPSVGDRWDYESSDNAIGPRVQIIEVVEVADVADGWRYVVEHYSGLEEWGIVPPRRTRVEWFLHANGAIWRGLTWLTRDFVIGPTKPFATIRELPALLERARFGYVEGRKRRRGWIEGVPTGRYDPVTGAPAGAAYSVRIAGLPFGSPLAPVFGEKRPRSTMTVHYHERLGRVGWSWGDSRGGWELVSARIDGEPYEP